MIKHITIRKYPEFRLKAADISMEIANRIREVYSGESIAFHSDLELAAFYELAYGLHGLSNIAGYTVQHGIFQGGSLCALAMGIRDSGSSHFPVVAFDPFEFDLLDKNEKYYDAHLQASEIMMRNTKLLEVREVEGIELAYVCPVIYPDIAFLKRFWSKPIRIVHIDTAKEYERTKEQLEFLLMFLVDGGWVLIHDYHADHPKYISAIHEFIDSRNTIKILRIDALICIQVKN